MLSAKSRKSMIPPATIRSLYQYLVIGKNIKSPKKDTHTDTQKMWAIVLANNRLWFLGCPQGYVLGVDDIYGRCDIFIGKTVLAHKENYYDSQLT